MSAIAAPTQIVENGFYVDPESGEILGVVTPKEEFHVTDQSSAEWVLEKRQALDAELAAIQARKSALLENLETMEKRVQARINSLAFRFDKELEQFASQNLAAGKKTWTCPFGSVSFRSTPARIKVSDEQLALQWATMFAPEAIKTTASVLVSMVDDEKKAEFVANPIGASTLGFEVIPAGEPVTIKTGVR